MDKVLPVGAVLRELVVQAFRPKLVNQDSGYDGSTNGGSAIYSVFIYVSESVIREFPFQRCYINYVSSILNLFPFPIYVGNRECPEGNQIYAGQ